MTRFQKYIYIYMDINVFVDVCIFLLLLFLLLFCFVPVLIHKKLICIDRRFSFCSSVVCMCMDMCVCV